MSIRIIIVALAALLPATVAVRALSQEPQVAATPKSDLIVDIEHAGGKVDTFSDEIVRLELVLSRAGRLDQLHLITQTGPDADTHIWYNMDNLVSVRYRFLEITGKGKVVVRTFAAPRVETPAAPPREIPALDPEDYR